MSRLDVATRVCALAVTAACAMSAAAAPASSPFQYAVFGIERVGIGPGVRVEAGDVGANLGMVRIGRGARLAGAAAAYEVRTSPGVVVRRLYCLFLDGPSTSFCKDVSIPLVTSTLALVQVLPGASEVRVPAGGMSAPLTPGAYGRLHVGSRGNLLLAGGRYDLRAMRIAPGGRLLCQGECDVAVAEGVRLGRGAALRAADTPPPAKLHLNIAGDAARVALRAGPRSSVAGIVYAPTGEVHLGARGRYVGSFIGRRVTIGARAHVRAGG